jgi:formylglycine-generating enzyme required for sulfatase activity
MAIIKIGLPNNSEGIINPLAGEFIEVRGGTFLMGAQSEYPNAPNYDADAEDDESPVHKVTLSDYFIGKYPVTQAQWKAVMGSNPSRFEGDNLPVGSVSWDDVQEFIRRLNQQTGKNYRLPTEAEWEFAARGGNQSRGYKYSGSNTPDNVAWYYENSGNKTQPFGTKQANELGIDMSGNVWEWCSDWYGDYSNASQTDPRGASTGPFRVSRRGSWDSDAGYALVSGRNGFLPFDRYRNLGFRLAYSYYAKIKNDLDTFLNGNFVLIEGNNQEYALKEKPDKKQNINKFYIGKYQVTQALYTQIMGCKNPSYSKGENLPVEAVTWYDCAAFCDKLSKKYGLDTYYNLKNIEFGDSGEIKKANTKINKTAEGFRLLTENEWEYAARYKSRTDGQECSVYAGSTYECYRREYDENDLAKYAWFAGNSDYKTHDVGTANNNSELAIHDMSGNVWEWCEDLGVASRVFRGGSYHNSAKGVRVTLRQYDTPRRRSSDLGFRLACVVK